MPNIDIVHDGLFDLATAKSSRAITWFNKEWKWSDFLNRISTTHRTHETYGEYLGAKKSRQDEIKNVGGYVSGYLSGGKRRSGSVLHRQMLTLDLDFATAGFWDDFTLTYVCAAAMYTTHKHSPDKPRLRLLIPLSRPVFTDEYEAIARKVAGNLDIEFFDPTTFQPERLMYWPSTSKDGTYEFEYQDGEWLDPDKVLSSYRDWKDSSEWPISVKVDKILQRNMQKQGDPLEKHGVIGAFCRTFTISEAIENFLDEVYEPCEGLSEGRYSYRQGSTAGGLITYDDKFAYSHHGTDPTSGKLCNAFDLVRIHKYGLSDEDAREGTPINKMPSYVSMVEFATKDANVRKLLGVERLLEAKGDFAEEDEDFPEEEENDDWLGTLDVDKKGNYYSTINNIVLILENDRAFKNNVAFDIFEQRAVAKKNLPWRKITYRERFLIDRDDSNIEHYLETRYNITATKLEKAMNVIYEKTKFHPIQEYLKSLTWDNQKRVDTLFIDYMGADDSAYTRAVTRKTLCAAVARVQQPGIKFDYLLTFVGQQGLGKSSLIGKLGKDWFSDSFATVQGKEAYEQLQGSWLIEMAELSGLRKADVEAVKHFLSKREDKFRVAYGRRIENFPRQCIFFGSTNKTDFLRDPTGNRRFWPVNCAKENATKDVFKDLTTAEIDQVWAEAVYLYSKGEKLFLSKSIEQAAFAVQREHSEIDDRTGLVQAFLEKPIPFNWDNMGVYERRAYLQDEIQEPGTEMRTKVCAAEIWCEVLAGQQKELTAYNTRPIHDIMREMAGWHETKSKTRFGIYGTQRGYYKEGTDEGELTSKNLEYANKN